VDRLFALCGHEHREIALDRLVHGYVDLSDPAWLGYGYERLYATILGRLWPARAPVACFFIGGGAYAFQRRLLARHGDGVRLTTAEIDPAVTRVAREWLALVEDPRHEIVHEDARTWVGARAPGDPPFDFVFGDAFDHIAVPWHLTTLEFARDVRGILAPDGVYLVNVVDTWSSGQFLGAFLATLGRVFAHVALLSTAPRMPDVRDTYVVVASDRPLVFAGPRPAEDDPEPVLVYGSDVIEDLCRRAGDRVLTDDDAPVEILLAPVARERVP
jgi:spermidine synthase